MDTRIRLVSALALLASLAACGGNDDLNVQGTWKGTNATAGNGTRTDDVAAIRNDGSGLIIEDAQTFYILPAIADGRKFIADGTQVFTGPIPLGFALPQQSFYGVGRTAGGDMSIDYESASAGNANVTPTQCGASAGCLAGTFKLQRYSPSMAGMALPTKTLQGVDLVHANNVQFAASGGNFTVSYANGCEFSGTLQKDSQTANFYTLGVTANSTSCKPPSSGLAFELDSDISGMFGHAAGNYLYVAFMDLPQPHGQLPHGFYVQEFRL